ncbi:MAG: D-2-hydroxyacid dehydrogenase [Woeseiaceae bacterium]
MNHSVLIVSSDAEQLAGLIHTRDGLAVATASDENEAIAAYDGQSILFGSPLLISKVIADMPAVEWVQSTWAGNTPLLEIARRDYVLTGIKDVFGPQMSEYVIGYLLAHELRVAQRLLRQQRRQWCPEQSGRLAGKRMGVMGTGSIGQAIAIQAANFGVSATGLSRTGRPVAGFEHVFPVERIREFLPGLDYLVAVLPDTAETTHLLDAETLAMLPGHAVFVNVGRANVVDDNALVAALGEGKLGGAVLDVFDEEPLPDESPLWDTPNLTITAHIAAVSYPELIVPIFLENYRRFTSNQEMMHIIDFEQGY